MSVFLLSRDEVVRRNEERSVEFRPFSHLQQLPPEPDWLWRGYLAAGSLTMLAGHPFKGKSMLVSGLLGALEESDGSLVCQPSGQRRC